MSKGTVRPWESTHFRVLTGRGWPGSRIVYPSTPCRAGGIPVARQDKLTEVVVGNGASNVPAIAARRGAAAGWSNCPAPNPSATIST